VCHVVRGTALKGPLNLYAPLVIFGGTPGTGGTALKLNGDFVPGVPHVPGPKYRETIGC
jgi:hypothetical protein